MKEDNHVMKWEKERFDVIARVRETLRLWPMFEPGDLVLVAVSGGADSLVLLDVLAQLGGMEELSLGVVHIDHGVRPESGDDADFVREVAAHYDLACSVKKITVRPDGRSPEEGLREARYAAFREELEERGAARLATGHTADDRVETLLLRLLAGAGPRGLGSIPPVRGRYVRPLIRVWRDEVEAYAALLPFAPRMDATNLDVSVPRNRVRRRLIPLLEEEYNPATRRALLRQAETLFEVGELMRGQAERAEMEGVELTARGLEMDLGWLLSLPTALQCELAAACLRRSGIEVDYDLVVDMLRKLPRAEGSASLDLGSGMAARKVYDRFIIGPLPSPAAVEARDIPGEGRYEIPELGMEIEVAVRPLGAGDPVKDSGGPSTAWLDADLITFPLRLRGVEPGDRFHPLGAPGRRKLQDFLVDLKVPSEERGKVAVVESDGEIIWVVGRRIDERFKVREGTARVAVLSVVPGDREGAGRSPAVQYREGEDDKI